MNITSRKAIVAGSALIALVVLLVAGGFAGSYFLALSALHNRNDLSIQQSCAHWKWVYAASAQDHNPHIHAAVGRTLGQLRCRP